MDYSESEYFGFLTNRGFKGPFEFNVAYEQHSTYVKGNIIIDIAYDGGFGVSIIKTKKLIPELESGTKKYSELEFNEYLYYPLSLLDPKHITNQLLSIKTKPNDQLRYYFELLKENPEILDGDLRKFRLQSRIWRKLGLTKKH
jgi:hypothetical protein